MEDQNIESIRVGICNLAGLRVFDTGEVLGDTLEWYFDNDMGEPLANGIYLYVVTVKGYEGASVKSKVRKLVILR